MKNILIYSPREINTSMGGVERVTDALARLLIKHGYSVTYLVKDRTSDNPYTTVTEEIHLTDNKKERKNQILTVLREKHIDVIINQFGFFSFLPRKKVPKNIKVISVIHDSYYAMYKTLPFGKLRLMKWKWVISRMLKTVYQDSDKIILFSKKFIPEYQFFTRNNDSSKFVIIPNFNAYEKTEILPKEKTVLFVGRMQIIHKKADYLLNIWKRVFNEHPDWNLKIVGDGDDRIYLEEMACELGLQNYSFEGIQNPISYYQRGSILCMTSSFESFGMVLTEAMQHKVVPMAFNSYSIVSEIIETGVDGFLIEPFDLDAYAVKLSLLMKDVELRNAMAEKAYCSVQKFSPKVIGERWVNLLDNIDQQ